jgi:hypothetical protein
MIGKRVIVGLAGSVVMLTATSGLVLAHGFGGPGGGGHDMWLLARAAGLNHGQVASAFQNDANLKTDRTNLKTAHEAMMSCLVSGKTCSSQIFAFSSALQTMAQERMTVWQNLFKSAPNPSQAANVYSQLQQLHSQKKQIIQNVLGSDGNDSAPGTSNGSSSNG